LTSGPPSVAVNRDVSADTLPLTRAPFAAIPSTRSSCVFTWLIVVLRR